MDVFDNGNFDSDYEESYALSVEKEVDEIRAGAPKLVRKTHPHIRYAVDSRSVDDYSEKRREYPGKWYPYFRLPKGFAARTT